MPLMITKRPVFRTGADMTIHILPEEWSALVRKENFLQRCIRKMRFGAAENKAHYIFYTGALDFSAFRKDYEKRLKYAARHGYKTVAVSCDDEIAFILANNFSKRFASDYDLQILLCLSEDVTISGSAIAKLEDLLFEEDEPVQITQHWKEHTCFPSPVSDEMCIPAEREYAASIPDEEDDGDYGFLEEEYFAPPLMSPTPPLQSKEPKIQSERPESRKIGASAPRESKAKSNSDFRNLKEFLKQNDAGFKDTLLKYIDRAGKKDSEVYKKANVDRRLFSKILNVQGYNPSKPTAIAFAIALELDLEETKDLISRAGYTLSQASTFDRIIEFFILESNYDIFEINEALFYFDQSLLGC